MKIRLPDIDDKEIYVENKQSIVLIGANGSGKTRLSIWIEENNVDIITHRISAQKSLNMPHMVSPTELEEAKEKFLYGETNINKDWLKSYGKKSYRWNNKPETHLLNDFDKLMEYLMTENYEKSIEYRENHKKGNGEFDNDTTLEKIKNIWENVITHRKLKIRAGKIDVYDIQSIEEDNYYNGSDMSDGERAIFYFIGQSLSAPKDSLIIIDEPENHLHKSILVRLWNSIEIARKDCTFLYITHSLEFASSRIDKQIIWVKSIEKNSTWDYKLIDGIEASDSLMLEMLGNRQKILLVEGLLKKSLDKRLYSSLFPEFNVIPVESCNSVINYTKAYRELEHIHYIDVNGIIDRDRRHQDEIDKYRKNNIFIPNVAEIENLFLLPEVIKIVCEKQDKQNYKEIINEVKSKTFEFLEKEIDNQALLFTKQKYQNEIYKTINASVKSIQEYKNKIDNGIKIDNIDEIYNNTKKELNNIILEKDFFEALKVINNKGLLPYTNLTSFFGWKKEYYIDYVILLLTVGDQTSEKLREAFIKYITLDK